MSAIQRIKTVNVQAFGKDKLDGIETLNTVYLKNGWRVINSFYAPARSMYDSVVVFVIEKNEFAS